MFQLSIRQNNRDNQITTFNDVGRATYKNGVIYVLHKKNNRWCESSFKVKKIAAVVMTKKNTYADISA